MAGIKLTKSSEKLSQQLKFHLVNLVSLVNTRVDNQSIRDGLYQAKNQQFNPQKLLISLVD